MGALTFGMCQASDDVRFPPAVRWPIISGDEQDYRHVLEVSYLRMARVASLGVVLLQFLLSAGHQDVTIAVDVWAASAFDPFLYVGGRSTAGGGAGDEGQRRISG